MEDLIAEFIAESREMLDALGSEIVAWEQAPSDRTRLDAIFRFVHTVKGNCGFFDLPRLETLSHAAEDVLAEVRAGKRAPDRHLVDAVLAVLDRIGELVQALETGEAVPSQDDSDLIAALTAAPTQTAEAAEAAVTQSRKSVRSIRLSIELLDRMMNGVSDMVLARNELARRIREAPTDMAVESAFERVSACIAEMRDAITRTRMQRIDTLFGTLPRMVRDLAAELGKEVALEVDGGDVELDREMIEVIRDPLTHIIRNAIDHGLEAPKERAKAGKPAAGQLRVTARQSGNQILIEVADDGRGIDGEKLVRKALASELISTEEAALLTGAQKAALVFEPGLSTAAEVTAISGRGVGMDVVRANIERIGGVVDLESKPGQGLRLTLRVPLTLTIIPALTVMAGGGTYAIPRSAIEEIVRCNNRAVRVEGLGGSWVASIRDKRLPMAALPDVLGVDPASAVEERSLIVLKPAGGDLYALAVDRVCDHEELVVKPAAPIVMATGLYAGTTIADDGSPVLLLDPSGVASAAGLVLDQNGINKLVAATAAEPEMDEAGTPALLFRALDGATRAMRLAVVERIEDVLAEAIAVTGGRLRVAIGERILPLAGCGGAKPEGGVRLFRLSDGRSELAYAFAEMIDMVELGPELRTGEAPGEIGGVTLVGGIQVEVVDPFWLFASADAEEEPGRRPVCALPSGDPWMNTFLRPIVEGAGYRIVDLDDEPADLVITGEDGDVPQAEGRVLKLRARPEPASPKDDSIYRYDRAGLLAALRQAGRAS
jgi:two-component system, chemotaxis family, sensor kinase CheA